MEYEDRLTIATPEGVELSLTLAGVASRFVAALVDLAIEVAILIALAVVLGLVGNDVSTGVAIGAWALVSFLLVIGYDVLFEVLNSGRTPGKWLNGLRVVRVEGHPVGFLTSAIRNVIRVIDFLPTAYLLGATVILATPKNQRIGDVVAGTLVVRERRASVRALPGPAAGSGTGPAATWETSRVTGEELAAVRRFLERRSTIDLEARRQLANTLAARLRPKVSGVPADVPAESFLEALASPGRREA